MARYSVNNYTVENLLSSLGDPVNTDKPISPAAGGGYCHNYEAYLPALEIL